MSQESTTASKATAVEDGSGGRTPVYSPFATGGIVTPECAQSIYRSTHGERFLSREKYPPLPWAMEDLIGTTWCNVHTGSRTVVMAIRDDQWHNPRLHIQTHYTWGDALLWTMGFWTHECHREEGRYVIEHWVRVDHVSKHDQLRWFRFHIEQIYAQRASHRAELDECLRKRDRVNARLREEDLEQDRWELAYAEAQLRDFEHRANTPPVEA